jgi:hypothetical protein
MPRSISAFLLLLLALFGCSKSQSSPGVWHVNGKPAPDTNWYKSDPPFGAQLFITGEEAAKDLYRRWETVPGNVRINPLASVKSGTPIETVVLFVRCAPDPNGNCRIEARATVKSGKGKVLIRQAPLTLSVRAAPKGDELGISERGVGLITSFDDRSYFFEMTVFDRIAKRKVELAQEIIVIE